MEFIKKYQHILTIGLIALAIIFAYITIQSGCNSRKSDDKKTADTILSHKLKDAILEGRNEVAKEIARQIDSSISDRLPRITAIEKQLQPIYLQPITNPDTAISFLKKFAKDNQ